MPIGPSGRSWPARTASLIYWVLSSLMVAEERITTKFSGLVRRIRQRGGGDLPRDPAGRRGAPHAVLRALSGRGRSPIRRRSPTTSSAPASRCPRPSAPSSTGRWWRPMSSWSKARRDAAAKVRFVTLYHQVLEGTLGLTSFNFVSALPRARATCSPASSPAIPRSTTTSSATSAMEPGTCAKPSRATRHSVMSSGQTLRELLPAGRRVSCSPGSRGLGLGGTRRRQPRRSVSSPSVGSPAD